LKQALAAALAAVLLCAAAPEDEAKRVLAAPDPSAIDYYALKTSLGPDGYKAMSQAVSRTLFGPPGTDIAALPCDGRRGRIMSEVLLATLAASPEAYAADRAAARDALARLEAFKREIAAGEALQPPYDAPARLLKTAATEPDVRKAELFRRAGRDQIARTHGTALMMKSTWAAGVTPNVQKYLLPIVSMDVCAIDETNTAWLKADLKAHRWYTISASGAEADKMAWLLAQHADRDRPFQREVLKILEGLLPTHETSASNYAYLYDRLADAEKRPQRYGTQGRCGPGQAWEPLPIEDPENVDKVRASVGLGPLAEYKTKFNCG